MGVSAPSVAKAKPVAASSLFASRFRPQPAASAVAPRTGGLNQTSSRAALVRTAAVGDLPSGLPSSSSSFDRSLATNPHRFAPALDYKIRGQLDLTPLDDAERQRLSEELQAGVITKGTAVERESNMRTWALLHRRWF